MLIIGGLLGSSFFYSRANPETNTILPVFGITAMSVYFFEKYLHKYITKRINERIAKVSKRIGQLEEVLRESTPIFHLIEEAQRFSQEREKTSNLVETADLGREIRDIYSHSPEMKHLNKQKGERLFDEMMN